jgi:hypothetical protein
MKRKKNTVYNTSRIRAEEKEFERKRSVKRTGNKRKMGGITGVKGEQTHKREEHKKNLSRRTGL